ncbi:phosphodiesterase [Burkholderia glumae]|uniref:Phosphodiesterase n=1 Tax=Burkholderia glumae TaxID=337 RepID=A0AAQ0BTZ2_BURGL|nr:phosphodiesterase [Burkholderia glumae]ACR28218.1 Ser/Thr protein phosphatase family protein [Burkholderia glumae BGR1]AJY67507.1 calcineurin-like phosphoesterase family protein [Burkholderia glumae LMG 2196 = ATCC 33617]KHJ62547.1 metallophosphatase [Burkholderia glumae]MCM2480792.1 phosphodiesterase [Burkholderia glumae]MCM2492520.1 phosphodiesterase [Burkholderia glumae]
MLLAQISDLHIKRPGALAYRRVDTAASLARTVARLNALAPRPDAVLITGDLTDFGHDDEYRHLKRLLAPLAMPYYLLIGNHDERGALRRAFAERAELQTGEFVQYALDLGPLRVIALDSQITGQSRGMLCDARLDWLAAELQAAAGRPVVVALHHPPFACGIAHMDAQRLDPAAARRLETILRGHPNVERVLCGHVHRPMVARFGGTLASAVGAPAHQVAFDLRADGPSAFTLEPPSFAVHRYDPAIGLVSHHVYVEAGDGPHPFYDDTGALID